MQPAPIQRRFDALCFDWGGTLMAERGGPDELPMAQWPQVWRIDGALELLARLHAQGERLCIATNASVSQRADVQQALQRAGLLRFVSDIFCYADIGHRKSDPAFWRVVQQRLGLPDLSRVAMVGDSLDQDVLGPLRCGVGAAVWFNAGGRQLLPAGLPPVAMAPCLAAVADLLYAAAPAPR